jgi:hypothetical protein
VALLVEVVHPCHPALHALLRALRRTHVVLACGLGHPVEIKKLAHVGSPSDFTAISGGFTYMTFEDAKTGH